MDTAQALDALNPFLPFGARWLPVAYWLLGGALAGALAFGVALWVAGRPLRRLRGAQVHWTERARVGHPVAVVSSRGGLSLPLVTGLVLVAVPNAFSAIPGVPGFAAAVALYLSGVAARLRATRDLVDLRLTFGQAVRGEWVGLLLLMPHLFIMIAMAVCIGPAFDALDVAQTGVGLAAFAVSSRSGGVPLLRLVGAARRAEQPLAGIVDEVARRAGVAARAVWVVRWPAVNAFALPWSGQLVFTQRMLENFDREEIAAFTAHELGHLSEPVSVKLVRSIGVFAIFPIGLGQPIVFRFGLGWLIASLAACYLVLFAVVRVARRMEQRADRVAHDHEADAGIYARALEKGHRLNGAPAVMPQKRPVHPHLYDRLLAAGVQPDYPRPAPPSRSRALAGLLCATLLGGLVMGALFAGPRIALRRTEDPDRAALWVMLVGNAEAAHLLGLWHAGDEDPEQAVAWLRVAHVLDPHNYLPGAYAAELLAYDGRCGAARAMLGEVETRFSEFADEGSEWLDDARDALAQCETEAPSRATSGGGA